MSSLGYSLASCRELVWPATSIIDLLLNYTVIDRFGTDLLPTLQRPKVVIGTLEIAFETLYYVLM